MPLSALPPQAKLKLDLMFHGIRYSNALGEAAKHAFPNFYPYRFQPGEPNPTGESKVPIPYLLTLEDGTLVRIKGSGQSAWHIQGTQQSGYQLLNDQHPPALDMTFEPLPEWMSGEVDGLASGLTGVSLHGDMAVINVAPGCEYFLHKHDGKSMRCTFCAYGAPDQRTAHLGQKSGQLEIPESTLSRMQKTLSACLLENDIRHIYLVGGSLPDWRQEGERFLQLARAVQDIVQHRIPVSLGSGALPPDQLDRFHAEKLVDSVCFNLEVYSEGLFSQVCPGKHRYVGYQNWINSLKYAVSLWGRGKVYSAMVAGIELEPEYGMEWQEAAKLAIEGADFLTRIGVLPIYSLYWPVGGREHPDYLNRLRSFFEELTIEYHNIRQREQLEVWEGFMCRRCAYMQLECDVDYGVKNMEAANAI